ncbi:MAG TPA: WbqC family protein, partial [Aquella sp.]|nr:WbqC family protein [Aquella sp.]
FPVIERIISYEENNLFAFILNSLNVLKSYLGINTTLKISSSIPIDHLSKAEKKVIEICRCRGATTYINPIGGLNLYSKEFFREHRIELKFIKSHEINYKQFENEYVPWLSIIDVMMFNTQHEINELLTQVVFL